VRLDSDVFGRGAGYPLDHHYPAEDLRSILMSVTFPNDDAKRTPEHIIEEVDRELAGHNETWPVYRSNTLQNRRQEAYNRKIPLQRGK